MTAKINLEIEFDVELICMQKSKLSKMYDAFRSNQVMPSLFFIL